MEINFPVEETVEGKAKIIVPKYSPPIKVKDYIPRFLPVFYNPRMILNRDIAVLALKTYSLHLKRSPLFVGEPLTGCGVRGIRFALEVENIEKVAINDINPKAYTLSIKNVKRNGLTDKIQVFNEEGNFFLARHSLHGHKFDAVDLDPFGSPVPFLDSAIRALKHKMGLLGVTATDMPPLCGVYPKVCLRKYGAIPLQGNYCHETAIRILIQLIARISARFEKGVKPVMCHSSDHYVRVYLIVEGGVKNADETIENLGYILHCFQCGYREIVKGLKINLLNNCPNCSAELKLVGPLWVGKIQDKKFCAAMLESAKNAPFGRKNNVLKLLNTICEEADMPATFYDTHFICRKLGRPVPKLPLIIGKLASRGYTASRTHFSPTGIKTDAPIQEIYNILSELP
ncbi:MAG: tRNA (guanine(10)-N(2))-dimethyltransferase [Candidatus Odinarchaeia archaeon]